MREALAPGVARILVHDGPATLGVQRCREIEESHGLRHLCAGLQMAVDAGEIQVRSIPTAARMLSAMLVESVIVISTADDAPRAHADATELVEAYLRGTQRFRGPPRP